MNKKHFIAISISALLLLLFVGFTILVKFVEVSPIGPNGSMVGFAGFNLSIFESLGQSEIWDKIGDIILILSITLAITFATIGAVQLIRRKNLKKIDKELICIAILYGLIILVYVFFELVPINFRPILIDGKLEASYPSTHTIITLCIFASAMIVSRHFLPNKIVNIIFNIISIVIMIVAIISRLLSGQHWATDIIGAILLSLFLVSLFYSFIKVFFNSNKKHIQDR